STSQILPCSFVSGIASLACTHKRSPGDGGVRRGFGVPLGGTVIAGDNHTTPYKPIGGVTKIVISDGLDKDGLCPARTKSDPRGFGRGRGNPKEKPRPGD